MALALYVPICFPWSYLNGLNLAHRSFQAEMPSFQILHYDVAFLLVINWKFWFHTHFSCSHCEPCPTAFACGPIRAAPFSPKAHLEKVTIALANIMKSLASKHSVISLLGVNQNWAKQRVKTRVTFIKWQGKQLAGNTDASWAQQACINKQL